MTGHVKLNKHPQRDNMNTIIISQHLKLLVVPLETTQEIEERKILEDTNNLGGCARYDGFYFCNYTDYNYFY